MVRRNIIANVIGRAWAVVSVYLFIPLYLKFLGVEAYGLVGFYATLVAVLAFADIGLTATLNREMARLAVRKNSGREQVDLLRTYETAYAWISLLVALLIWFLAPLIANHWLRSNSLDPGTITSVIRLMGVSISLQLPSNLYQGGLMGLQRQVLANSLQVGWGLFRGVGAVLVLWLLCPTVFAFACWQLLANLFYCLGTRATLWRAVSRGDARPRFQWLVFRRTWRYALGMAGMTLISAVLGQSDKLAVSKLLPLEAFGYYMLAVALAAVPTTLASPIGTAVFPRMTGLVEADERHGLALLYRRTTAMVAVVVIPGGLTLALFAGDFLLAWTGNAAAAELAGPTASLLIIGGMIQSILVLPYLLALAHGNVRLNLQIGIVSIVLVTPLLILLIRKYGLVGAGISWVAMNVCTLPPYMFFVHRRFLPGELRRWCASGVGYPLLIAMPCVLAGLWLAPHTDSRLWTFGWILMVGVAATAATAAIMPEVRSDLLREVRWIVGAAHRRRESENSATTLFLPRRGELR